MFGPHLIPNLFADDSILCHDISHPSDRHEVTSSLSSDLDKIRNWSNTWNMSFKLEKSRTITLCHRKDHSANSPMYFLNNRLKEVQSLKLLGLTLSHDLSWANHILKLAPKANHRLSILRHAKSFLAHLNSYPPTRPSSIA